MRKKKVLSQDDVRHIALLAKLLLNPEEVKKYEGQLIRIFDYIDLVAEMSTENTKETSHPTAVNNVFREDKIDKSRMLSQIEALSNAPKSKNGYFIVKAIFA